MYGITGLKVWPAGRIDENPSIGLSNSLKVAGFQLARLKTGKFVRTGNALSTIPGHC